MMQGRLLCWRVVRRTCIAAGFAFCAASAPPQAVAEGFLSSIEDLPLAPGLSEDRGDGLSFDAAAGRIVDAYARGDVDEASVLKFYEETLPQLGWTADSARQYRRNGERLRLEVNRGAQGLIVHYSLSPQ